MLLKQIAICLIIFTLVFIADAVAYNTRINSQMLRGFVLRSDVTLFGEVISVESKFARDVEGFKSNLPGKVITEITLAVHEVIAGECASKAITFCVNIGDLGYYKSEVEGIASLDVAEGDTILATLRMDAAYNVLMLEPTLVGIFKYEGDELVSYWKNRKVDVPRPLEEVRRIAKERSIGSIVRSADLICTAMLLKTPRRRDEHAFFKINTIIKNKVAFDESELLVLNKDFNIFPEIDQDQDPLLIFLKHSKDNEFSFVAPAHSIFITDNYDLWTARGYRLVTKLKDIEKMVE